MKKLTNSFLVMMVIFTLNCCQTPTDNDTIGAGQVQNYDLTVHNWEWTYDNLYERHTHRFDIANPEYGSAVLAYVMSGSGKQAIPYYTCPSFMCEQYDMADNLFDSSPFIEFQFTNYISRTTGPNSDEYFYLVIIPPGKMLEHPNLDLTNYEEVRKAFNLGEPVHLK